MELNFFYGISIDEETFHNVFHVKESGANDRDDDFCQNCYDEMALTNCRYPADLETIYADFAGTDSGKNEVLVGESLGEYSGPQYSGYRDVPELDEHTRVEVDDKLKTWCQEVGLYYLKPKYMVWIDSGA
jgi:hypothetical protein